MTRCSLSIELRRPWPFALLFWLGLTAGVSAQDVLTVLQNSLVESIEGAEKSVVSIARTREQFPRQWDMNDDPNDPDSPNFVPNEFGSGVLLNSPDGTLRVLTNYHVVRTDPALRGLEIPQRLFVWTADRRRYEVIIYAADPRSDLAVLEFVSDLRPNLPGMMLGEGDKLKKGQLVITLGNPYALARDGSASASLGMISNLARLPVPIKKSPFDMESRKKETLHHYGTLLQIDSRLNLGTSGGAVVDLQGKLVGITTSLAALEGYEKSSGFAVPMDSGTQRIVETLLQGYEVEYGFLGLHPASKAQPGTPPELYPHPTAATINSVSFNSPASRAECTAGRLAGTGLRPGDLIIRVNQKPIFNDYDLMREVGVLGPSESATEVAVLDVLRNSGGNTWTPGTFRVRLGKWPAMDDAGIIASRKRYEWGGLTLDYATGRHKYLDQTLREFHDAALITEVAENSPLHDKLRPGSLITEVNGQAVTTPQDFLSLVQNQTEVTLTVLNGKQFTLVKKNNNWTLTLAGN